MTTRHRVGGLLVDSCPTTQPHGPHTQDGAALHCPGHPAPPPEQLGGGRPTASQITDDQLDQLHEQLDTMRTKHTEFVLKAGERIGQAEADAELRRRDLDAANARAEHAEQQLAQVRAYAVAARTAMSGSLCTCPDDCERDCGNRPLAWTLDPAAVLAVLDSGEQPHPACPGETDPPTCACPCDGCRHHCAAHQPGPDGAEHRPVNVRASAEAELPPECSCGANIWCDLPTPTAEAAGRHLRAALDSGEQPECTGCGGTGACAGGPCAHPNAQQPSSPDGMDLGRIGIEANIAQNCPGPAAERWDTFDAQPGTTDYTRQQALLTHQPGTTAKESTRHDRPVQHCADPTPHPPHPNDLLHPGTRCPGTTGRTTP